MKSLLRTERARQNVLLLLFSLAAYLAVAIYACTKVASVALPFLLLSACVYLLVATLYALRRSEFLLMAAMLCILGAFYFWIAPFEMVPDEPEHFKRAFEVSTGHLVSQVLSDGAGGNILPRAVEECWNRSAVIDWGDTKEVAYSNTALYSFVCYIPQSLGIALARLFTGRIAVLYYAGRLCNFLTALALSLWALRRLPFARKPLFVLMVMPMTLQEMISLAPDALVNSLSFAFVALILDCAYRRKRILWKDVALISAMLCVIALCKIVYIVFLLFVYLIPCERYADVQSRRVLRLGIPLLAVLLNLIWLLIASRFLVEFNPGVDSKAQVLWILHNPHAYFVRVIRTASHFYNWVTQICGARLGWLDINMNSGVWFGMLLCFLFTVARCNDIGVTVRERDCLVFLLVALGGCLLIFTSLYVQWTPVRAPRIQGIQGRYFIPLLPPLFLVFAYRNRAESLSAGNVRPVLTRSSYLFTVLLTLNLVALVRVYGFYRG